MKSVAILTMVYDDDIFLRIWLSYWERFVSRSSLYVLIHADYEHYEQVASGCNTIRIARPPLHRESEVNRWKMLSKLASGLTYMFDRVIYTDVDEIIAIDPKIGNNPIEYIFNTPKMVISPYGVDVVDPIELGLPPIDLTQPVLSQRPFVASSAPYSKPCITSEVVSWGTGGHYSDKEEIYLSNALVLFHLRLFDKATYDERSAKRRAMVTDPETGQLILGPGGPGWKRTDEFKKYSVSGSEPVDDLAFSKDRKRWVETAQLNEQGFWERKGKLRKRLVRIPERFTSVF